jgi:sulfite exporter TauE/SafE
MIELLPVLLSAFMAGLLGSGHCFAMCGGIAGSLGVLQGRTAQPGSPQFLAALQFNLGRILAYAGLGLLLALGLGVAGDLLQVQSWGRVLRIASAVLVAMIGLHYLLDWRGIAFIERAGAGLWRKVSPLAMRASQRGDGAGRLLVGLCWGLLPCGLVYTVLATAASTGDAASGAATMLAFGLGTLPAMLGLTLAAPAVSVLFRDRVFRRLVGFFLLLLAAWMIYSLGMHAGSAHQHHEARHSTHEGGP